MGASSQLIMKFYVKKEEGHAPKSPATRLCKIREIGGLSRPHYLYLYMKDRISRNVEKLKGAAQAT